MRLFGGVEILRAGQWTVSYHLPDGFGRLKAGEALPLQTMCFCCVLLPKLSTKSDMSLIRCQMRGHIGNINCQFLGQGLTWFPRLELGI